MIYVAPSDSDREFCIPINPAHFALNLSIRRNNKRSDNPIDRDKTSFPFSIIHRTIHAYSTPTTYASQRHPPYFLLLMYSILPAMFHAVNCESLGPLQMHAVPKLALFVSFTISAQMGHFSIICCCSSLFHYFHSTRNSTTDCKVLYSLHNNFKSTVSGAPRNSDGLMIAVASCICKQSSTPACWKVHGSEDLRLRPP